MKSFSRILCQPILASVLLISMGTRGPAWAQPSTGGPAPQAPLAVPLDGGASLLLAGVGLGVRRLRQSWRAQA